MNIEWEKLGKFVESVGIPFAVVVLLIAPLVYAVYWFITRQGPKIVEKHNNFVERQAVVSERNADSIAMMAASNSASQANHEATHNAIKEIVRGARKAVEKFSPDLSQSVIPHLDRAEQAIEKAG